MNKMPRRNLVLCLIVILGIALVPRLLYVIQIETPPFSDERDYLDCAENLLQGKGLMMANGFQAYRAPGYPLMLAVIKLITSDVVMQTRILQAILDSFSCVILSLIGIRLFKSLAWGLAAGIIAALFDELIFFTGQLLTETVFTFGLLIWIVLVFQTLEKKTYLRLIQIGLVIGLLTLIRPAGLFLILAPIILMSVTRSGLSWKQISCYSGVILVGVFLMIAPWTVRNALVLGRFVPLTTNDGVNLYIGHNPYFGYWSTGNKTGIRQAAKLGEVDESRLFARLAREYAVQHPMVTIKNSMAKFYHVYLAPWPYPYRTDAGVKRGVYKPWPWFEQNRELRFAGQIRIPLIPWSVPLFVLAMLGLILTIREDLKWKLLALIWVCHTLPCMIYFGNARFRLPVIPLMLFFALLACRTVVMVVRARIWVEEKPLTEEQAGGGSPIK